jgi:predicted membrane protein
MGKEAALFTFVIPFLMSSAVGTAISMVLIRALDKTKAMSHLKKILEGEM